MDARAVLIAFVFAAAAAGFVWLGFQGQARYDAAQAEQAALAPAPASAAPSSVERVAPARTGGDLTREDRRVIALLCIAVAWAAWLWLLLAAFGEGMAWGFVVLLGNWAGALVFCLFGPRPRLAPLAVMNGAYGLLLGLGLYWTRAAN